ncbi:alpha/beta hydrolase family protein [Chryseobacterium ginsenosidimutans]|uniref:alpha/beta hydrolase family protein n=1 Tax=Chryseobacterium ginsenosidimutans TaxID=687846 RepID=UPI0027BAD5FE|nr:alpha/beta hydrolase [Chryseobacterium ginsenosidimutans]
MYSQTPQGHYEGALTQNGSDQLISFDFSPDKTTYDIPEIGYMNVKTEKISQSKDTLKLKISYGDFYCFLDSKTGDLTGLSKNINPEMRLHLKKTAAKEKSFSEEEIKFSNADVSLSGVLFKPKKSEEPVPYVILVHRSGWEDRETAWYHSMAYILASKGMGVLLYDKRGTDTSTGNFSLADLNDLAEDAASAFNYLKARNDLNYSKIGFLGASQGGWIIPLAANKVSNCGFAILVVGPAVSVYEQDINRVQYTLMDEGYSKESINSALRYSGLFFKYIQSNTEKDWNALKKYTTEIKGQKWIDYIDIPQSKTGDDVLWWRKNKYDPKEALSEIKCPVLSIFGEKDVLVPPAENKSKMENYLTKAGVNHKIVIIKDCGHNMITQGKINNGAKVNWPYTYWQWQKQPDEFVNTIFEFIKK